RATVRPRPVARVVVGEGRRPVRAVQVGRREVDVLPGSHRERPRLAVRTEVATEVGALEGSGGEGRRLRVAVGKQANPVGARAWASGVEDARRPGGPRLSGLTHLTRGPRRASGWRDELLLLLAGVDADHDALPLLAEH